jgi:hypothetical protein
VREPLSVPWFSFRHEYCRHYVALGTYEKREVIVENLEAKTQDIDYELVRLVGGGVQLGPLDTAATDWPIVACSG